MLEDYDKEQPYSNRELREKWNDISASLANILEQTQKTNGRVTALEGWKNYIMGAISMLGIVVVPLLAWALYVLTTIDTRVAESVDRALSVYDIKVK